MTEFRPGDWTLNYISKSHPETWYMRQRAEELYDRADQALEDGDVLLCRELQAAAKLAHDLINRFDGRFERADAILSGDLTIITEEERVAGINKWSLNFPFDDVLAELDELERDEQDTRMSIISTINQF